MSKVQFYNGFRFYTEENLKQELVLMRKKRLRNYTGVIFLWKWLTENLYYKWVDEGHFSLGTQCNSIITTPDVLVCQSNITLKCEWSLVSHIKHRKVLWWKRLLSMKPHTEQLPFRDKYITNINNFNINNFFFLMWLSGLLSCVWMFTCLTGDSSQHP